MQDNAVIIEHRRRFQLEEALLILLLLFSLLGIGVTHFSPEDGYAYWLFMVLVFGFLAVCISWLKSKKQDFDLTAVVKEQSLHWLSSLLIVAAAFLLQKSGRIDEFSASLVILLILALATILDGIRIGWQFSLVGFYLAACAVIEAFISQVMLTCGSLAVAIIAGTIAWEIWAHSRAYQ